MEPQHQGEEGEVDNLTELQPKEVVVVEDLEGVVSVGVAMEEEEEEVVVVDTLVRNRLP